MDDYTELQVAKAIEALRKLINTKEIRDVKKAERLLIDVLFRLKGVKA